MDQTRRALLRRTIPLAATGGVAGCSTFSTSSSTETSTTAGTAATTRTETATRATVTDSETVGQWLFAPSAIDRDDYSFLTLQPSTLLEHADALPAARVRNLRNDIGLAGFDTLGSLRSIHRIAGDVTVYDGPFERDTLVTELTDAGFSDGGTHRGFDLYSPDEKRAVAVGDGQVVLVDRRRREDVSATASAVAKSALDAATGNGESYRTVDADCDALLTALGTGHVVIGQGGSTGLDTEAALAQGGRWRVGSETTQMKTAVVFENSGATDTDAVESWATTAGPYGETTPTLSTDGRVVLATADVPTSSLGPFDLSSSSTDTPQASFTFEYDGEAGTVTITHGGGDPVPAGDLQIRGNGFAERESADQTAAGTWGGETSGEENAVASGDSVVIGVTPSYQLLLLYSGGDSGVTLGSDSGPEA
ncbi:hypothetical protein BRC91_05110 [Halobacteriales archaeon QS_4_62_28]|nr:MAG: hypothetical protein BRC91_05110 [Halobacteriales archaeon QS_4_62_28]